MKIRLSNQKTFHSLRKRAGMTLVEVMVALAIAGLMVAGIVRGYIFCSTSTVKDSLYMAANARAMERLEETHSAIWSVHGSTPMDELVATNFPDETNIVLDLSGSGSEATFARITTDISQILPSASSPDAAPVKKIHVNCIWEFNGELITNSIETCRAPD